MKPLILIPLLAVLCAAEPQKETPKLSDSQKLAIREAQAKAQGVQLAAIEQRAKLEAQISEALKKVQEKLTAAIEDARKTCGGDVIEDADGALACAPKKETSK